MSVRFGRLRKLTEWDLALEHKIEQANERVRTAPDTHALVLAQREVARLKRMAATGIRATFWARR